MKKAYEYRVEFATPQQAEIWFSAITLAGPGRSGIGVRRIPRLEEEEDEDFVRRIHSEARELLPLYVQEYVQKEEQRQKLIKLSEAFAATH